MSKAILRKRILKLVSNYHQVAHKPHKFVPGKSPVRVAGRVYGASEMRRLVDSALEFWLTEGRYSKQFERAFAKLFGVDYVSLTNSGSSANLVAFSSLTSPALGKRALQPGDEVITVATGFPTTVNPIIQNGCVPVFIDVDLVTRNATYDQLKKAVSKKTKAIMMAHTLGNPFPIEQVMKLVKKHDLWLIEDCCDALGSTYNGKLVGTFGHLATFSFYPAHQITMGEGGAVITNHPLLHRGVRQFRDWGRDCWCDTGKDNTCGKRFAWKLGELPFGYDHKYIYSHIGYNLKLTDMQAAVGVVQLGRLSTFIKKRKANFEKIYRHLKKYKKYLILPKKEKEADPCWFGFMIVVADGAPFTRLDLVNFLESEQIATRSLFGGNLLRHPAYLRLKAKRTVGKFKNSDKIMKDGFWIGVYPGITGEMLQFVLNTFDRFFRKY